MPGEGGQERKTMRMKTPGMPRSTDTDPICVMFTPRTPNGELTTMLRSEEAKLTAVTEDKVKFVERAGMMLKRALCRNNPWAGENCGRVACQFCKKEDERNGNCRKRNIVYQNQCLACLAKGKESIYYGETSRTGYERGQEHARDRDKEKEESHMFWHTMEEHEKEEGEVKFRMKVVKAHTSAMMRQIHEATLIKRYTGQKNILNSKLEYNRCILPELTVQMGWKTYNISEQEEEMQVGKSKGGKRREKEEEPAQPAAKRKKRWQVTVGKRKVRQLATDMPAKRRKTQACQGEDEEEDTTRKEE